MSVQELDPAFKDPQTVIFGNYLALVQEAVDDEDLQELEKFWTVASKLGSRGLLIRTLINKGAETIIKKRGRIPFMQAEGYRYPRGGPYDFQTLLMPKRIAEVIDAIQKKNFLELEGLINENPEFARLFYFRFLKYPEKKLSPQELASFLYLLAITATVVPDKKERNWEGPEDIIDKILEILLNPREWSELEYPSEESSEEEDEVMELPLTDEQEMLLELFTEKMRASSTLNKEHFKALLETRLNTEYKDFMVNSLRFREIKNSLMSI